MILILLREDPYHFFPMGRSSDFRIILPAHLPASQDSGIVNFRTGYSGATATDLHRLPLHYPVVFKNSSTANKL